MMFLGAFLFTMFFVLLAPQTRHFLGGVMLGAATFVHNWAPFSYVLLLVIMGTLVAAIYLMHTWPVRVDPENPMSKYNKEPPFEE